MKDCRDRWNIPSGDYSTMKTSPEETEWNSFLPVQEEYIDYGLTGSNGEGLHWCHQVMFAWTYTI